jgi:hypothetical protein
MATDLAADRPVSGSGPEPPAAGGRPGRWTGEAWRWVAGAVAVVGIAWLVLSLVTALAVYTTLSTGRWRGAVNAAGGASLSILVADTGTGSANCQAQLQVGSGPVRSGPVATIPVKQQRQLTISLRLTAAVRSHPTYVWLQCGGNIMTRHLLNLPPSGPILQAASAVVTRSKSYTQVQFRVTSPGRVSGWACSASVALSNGQTITRGGQRPVSAGRGAGFKVGYLTRSESGAPARAWGTCLARGTIEWAVSSTATTVPAS